MHKSKLPSLISLPKHYLKAYDLATPLIAGLYLGFPIPSSIQDWTSTPTKHKSVQDTPDIVQHHIDKELQAGHIEGSFIDKPFYNFIFSQLGLVPKKVTNHFCLIHDLFFPRLPQDNLRCVKDN